MSFQISEAVQVSDQIKEEIRWAKVGIEPCAFEDTGTFLTQRYRCVMHVQIDIDSLDRWRFVRQALQALLHA